MPVHAELTREIMDSPRGPQIGAFFDFDGTVMAGFSATEFLKEQLKRGQLSIPDLLETIGTIGSFGVGNTGFSGLMTASAKILKGISEKDYIEFGERVYEKQIAKLIYPESRALIRAHQRMGHTVAIVSSATPYQVEPAARDLKVEHVMCSNLEVEDGAFNGQIIRPLCFGEGKVIAADTLAKSHGVDLKKSYFYTDSYDDIELLEAVGEPRPLNPNAKLVEVAEERGWPVQRFKSRGRPRATDLVRSLAADLSLIPVFATSLPIWALTGSKRDAQNFAFSLFSDVASALIGLNLDVKGEHNLWVQRPAVFIFNHQSKADVMITAKLLRRDIAGVGKKEIGNYPVLGQIMEFGGTVLIDRKNAASAIEAMEPLVRELSTEGKSVLMAPEGTRTLTPNLGPFKKGAFHLAMQAGVPIVPIVIHNANDVAPKGAMVYRRATVAVEVLEPIDTSDWHAGTINEHVKYVRDLYLKVLGQDEAAPPSKSGTAEAKSSNAAATKKRSKAKTSKATTGKKATRVKKSAATSTKTSARAKKSGAKTSKKATRVKKSGAETSKKASRAKKSGAETSKKASRAKKSGAETSKKASRAKKSGAETSRKATRAKKSGAETSKNTTRAKKSNAQISKKTSRTTQSTAKTSKETDRAISSKPDKNTIRASESEAETRKETTRAIEPEAPATGHANRAKKRKSQNDTVAATGSAADSP